MTEPTHAATGWLMPEESEFRIARAIQVLRLLEELATNANPAAGAPATISAESVGALADVVAEDLQIALKGCRWMAGTGCAQPSA